MCLCVLFNINVINIYLCSTTISIYEMMLMIIIIIITHSSIYSPILSIGMQMYDRSIVDTVRMCTISIYFNAVCLFVCVWFFFSSFFVRFFVRMCVVLFDVYRLYAMCHVSPDLRRLKLMLLFFQKCIPCLLKFYSMNSLFS